MANERDTELLAAGWQFNTQTGLYRHSDDEAWVPHGVAREITFGSPAAVRPKVEPPKYEPSVLEEIRNELRAIRRLLERSIGGSGING